MFIREKRGQSILEYAILMGVVVAVIVAIQIYVKRAYQGRLKASADQIGDQFTTGQNYTIQSIQQSARAENTLSGDVAGGTLGWAQSKIQETANATWANTKLKDYTKKAGNYTGAEISATDYVKQDTKGEGKVAGHSTFETDKYTGITLFGDDD